MAQKLKFTVKIHHRSYGVITHHFDNESDAYKDYLAASDPKWHDCVTMYFSPNGFVLNQWRAQR